MQPPNQCSRIDLPELKAQIVKNLGPEGSKQYFYYLQKFLSLKLNKADFNKLCLRILGQENVSLHNRFIRSILRNACVAKSPLHASDTETGLNHGIEVGSRDIPVDGYQQNGFHISTNQASCSTGLLNGGDMLPVSPRKARTGLRDRRNGDHRSALRHVLKSNNLSIMNGDLTSHNVGRPMQQVEDENDNLISYTSKLPIERMSTDDHPVSVDSKELLLENDGSKVASSRSPLQAPLGLPLCPVNTGGTHTALPPARSCKSIGTFSDGGLLDNLTLRERMEHIAVGQGVEGISVECANLLNLGLDSYLKGLIRSCLGIVGARSENDANFQKQETRAKLINGVKPGHQPQMPNNDKHFVVQESKVISLQDFRVAMELRPCQLGEDWPLLLEKICTQAFEE